VRTIEVTGSAKRRITSDLVEWQARVEARAPDLPGAVKTLHADVDRTIAYLKAQGVKDEEIRVSSVSREEVTETQYEKLGPEDFVPKQVLIGHAVSQYVVVTSTDVAKVERLSREVTGLIEQGVKVDSLAPAYFYTKLGELKIEMLAEASKDARTRADRLVASAAGQGGLALRWADMGVINVNPANETSGSWDGNNDTSSLDKDIITIVHCAFDLK
jgi:hypothetical protein